MSSSFHVYSGFNLNWSILAILPLTAREVRQLQPISSSSSCSCLLPARSHNLASAQVYPLHATNWRCSSLPGSHPMSHPLTNCHLLALLPASLYKPSMPFIQSPLCLNPNHSVRHLLLDPLLILDYPEHHLPLTTGLEFSYWTSLLPASTFSFCWSSSGH